MTSPRTPITSSPEINHVTPIVVNGVGFDIPDRFQAFTRDPRRPDLHAFADLGTGVYLATYLFKTPLPRGFQVPGALSVVMARFGERGEIRELERSRGTDVDGPDAQWARFSHGRAGLVRVMLVVVEIDATSVAVLEAVYPNVDTAWRVVQAVTGTFKTTLGNAGLSPAAP